MILHTSSMFAANLPEATENFYRDVIRTLNAHSIPYLLGGAYALAFYTGIVRDTKDVDVFVRPDDCPRTLESLADAGYETALTFAHWLAKAAHGENFVDVIFSSGNGIARVDDLWFTHSRPAVFLGQPVHITPVEEMIWSKGYVCERERYDGADINHLLRAHGHELDWPRLLRRFGDHWRVLLSHLVLFGFAYPSDRDRIPTAVMEDLGRRLSRETAAPPSQDRPCHGLLLSRIQYLTDLEQWGYRDARLESPSAMTPAEIEAWTAAGLAEN
jgi:hypothetical protein